MKTIKKIRENEVLKRVILYGLTSWALFGVILSYSGFLFRNRVIEKFLTSSVYFTIQSNLLVLIVLILHIFNIKAKKLSFITLVNIAMTSIVFHMMLTSFMGNINFTNHVLHTFTPLFYLLYYFIFYPFPIVTKQFWISLIYPLFYLLFVFLIVSPFMGEMMSIYVTRFEGSKYVYPFLNPNNYRQGLMSMLSFNLLIMMPAFAIISIIICFFKNRLERSLSE